MTAAALRFRAPATLAAMHLGAPALAAAAIVAPRAGDAADAVAIPFVDPGPPAASRPAIDRFLAAARGPDAFLPR